MITGRQDAVDAARHAGAGIVLVKPFDDGELRAAGRKMGLRFVGETDSSESALARLVGASAAMQKLREEIVCAARGHGCVLIQGETGVGKELVARAIHAFHGRGPFQAVNCGTLGELAESQLFGHARGAFTSAVRSVRGALEQAGDGVLFLDEIGDLPRAAQVKLVRAIEGQRFQALADEKWLALRARLVAASHVDLEAAMAEGHFRDDLFYRLAVHVIHVPPLRDRLEDLPALVPALLQRLPRPKRMTEDAVAALTRQRWPGNVRQLAGFLERLAVRTDDDTIGAEDVLAVEQASFGSSRPPLLAGPAKVQVALPLGQFDAEMDAHALGLIERALEDAGGNVTEASRRLGVDRMVIVRRMQKQRRR